MAATIASMQGSFALQTAAAKLGNGPTRPQQVNLLTHMTVLNNRMLKLPP